MSWVSGGVRGAVTVITALLVAPVVAAAQEAWPRRVLLTNDNGIDDPKLHALARAFAAVAETFVVAPDRDRSGSSNLLSVSQTGRFAVQRRDLGPGIHAYALDGYPADCVVFGLLVLLADQPPDLVVSGINGGPNLADDWFGSGTIGAARTAAYLGVPSIAVSGLATARTAAYAPATSWVVAFAASPLVRALNPPEYLTISLPLRDTGNVTGISLVTRARGLFAPVRERLSVDSAAGREVWSFRVEPAGRAAAGSDVAGYAAGQVVIVPMRADEGDPALRIRLDALRGAVPPWPREER